MKKYLTLAALLCCQPLWGAQITFQNGANDYDGYREVQLQGNYPDTQTAHLSQREKLIVSGVAWGGARQLGLLRFDGIFDPARKGLPPNAHIVNAILELHKIGENADAHVIENTRPPQRVVSVFRMLTPFYESHKNGGYSCFSYRLYGGSEEEYWGDENRITEGPVKGTDFDSQPVGTLPIEPGLENQWYSVDVTNTVRDWQNAPSTNQGFFLTAHGYWLGLQFAGATFPDTTLRPRLVIEYER